MNEATRVSDCLPEPPTPTSRPLPRGLSMMREMRAINFVTKLIDRGIDDGGRLKRVNIHTIDAEDHLGKLSISSKLNADWAFLSDLHAVGREKASEFIRDHYDKIGVCSSTDIETKFL